jgi:hypothetical protein
MKRQLIVGPILELRCPRRFLSSDLLSRLKSFLVFQVNLNPVAGTNGKRSLGNAGINLALPGPASAYRLSPMVDIAYERAARIPNPASYGFDSPEAQ